MDDTYFSTNEKKTSVAVQCTLVVNLRLKDDLQYIYIYIIQGVLQQPSYGIYVREKCSGEVRLTIRNSCEKFEANVFR